MSNIAPVQLMEYTPKWRSAFEREKLALFEALSSSAIEIEHIGSTSIPGSISKPEIDIMIGVENINDAGKYIEPLEKIGYEYFQRFEEFEPNRRYFRKSDGIKPLVHIHMVENDSVFWRGRILFRDYLRRSPEIVWRYNKLKKGLVEKFEGDRIGYSNEKDKFVLQVLNALNN